MKALSNRYVIPLSITETLNSFKTRGYQLQFRREASFLYSTELNVWITPANFTVDEYHHFEERANPDGDRILYAISSTGGLKGFLVDTCFVYEDNISAEMMKKLQWEYANAAVIQTYIKN